MVRKKSPTDGNTLKKFVYYAFSKVWSKWWKLFGSQAQTNYKTEELSNWVSNPKVPGQQRIFCIFQPALWGCAWNVKFWQKTFKSNLAKKRYRRLFHEFCQKMFVVYFDQLSGACSTWKLVELLFLSRFQPFLFLMGSLLSLTFRNTKAVFFGLATSQFEAIYFSTFKPSSCSNCSSLL